RRAGRERIDARAFEPSHDRIPLWIREVDVESTARRVIGREREAEQALLATAADLRRQIQEIGCRDRPGVDDANPSALLDDVLNRRIRGILDECQRKRKARNVHVSSHRQLSRCRRGRGAKQQYGPRQNAPHPVPPATEACCCEAAMSRALHVELTSPKGASGVCPDWVPEPRGAFESPDR